MLKAVVILNVSMLNTLQVVKYCCGSLLKAL